MRGALGGLAGMPAQRRCHHADAWIVRPFLALRKKDILAFLSENRISFRVDRSNQEDRFTRNKIRHKLIPLMQKNFNPAVIDILNATAQALGHQRDLIDSLTQKYLLETRCPQRLEIAALKKLPMALRTEVLKRSYEAAGGDMAKIKNIHIQGLAGLAAGLAAAKQQRISSVRIRREQGLLVFESVGRVQRREEQLDPAPLKVPGLTTFAGGAVRTMLKKQKRNRVFPSQTGTAKSYRECFDWDTLMPPLTVRARRPGDRYQPIGLHGTKKVKDILIEMKIPLSQRDRLPILQDATGKIIWLAGYRIADFCKVHPTTRTILQIALTLG